MHSFIGEYVASEIILRMVAEYCVCNLPCKYVIGSNGRYLRFDRRMRSIDDANFCSRPVNIWHSASNRGAINPRVLDPRPSRERYKLIRNPAEAPRPSAAQSLYVHASNSPLLALSLSLPRFLENCIHQNISAASVESSNGSQMG